MGATYFMLFALITGIPGFALLFIGMIKLSNMKKKPLSRKGRIASIISIIVGAAFVLPIIFLLMIAS